MSLQARSSACIACKLETTTKIRPIDERANAIPFHTGATPLQ